MKIIYFIKTKTVGNFYKVGQKRWKVETFSRLDSVLLLSSVNLPGGELVRRFFVFSSWPLVSFLAFLYIKEINGWGGVWRGVGGVELPCSCCYLHSPNSQIVRYVTVKGNEIFWGKNLIFENQLNMLLLLQNSS